LQKNASKPIKPKHIEKQMPELFVDKHITKEGPEAVQQLRQLGRNTQKRNQVYQTDIEQDKKDADHLEYEKNSCVDENKLHQYIPVFIPVF
jgi:hypothetical protein